MGKTMRGYPAENANPRRAGLTSSDILSPSVRGAIYDSVWFSIRDRPKNL
jgi:hypothetical protein